MTIHHLFIRTFGSLVILLELYLNTLDDTIRIALDWLAEGKGSPEGGGGEEEYCDQLTS